MVPVLRSLLRSRVAFALEILYLAPLSIVTKQAGTRAGNHQRHTQQKRQPTNTSQKRYTSHKRQSRDVDYRETQCLGKHKMHCELFTTSTPSCTSTLPLSLHLHAHSRVCTLCTSGSWVGFRWCGWFCSDSHVPMHSLLALWCRSTDQLAIRSDNMFVA